MKEHRAKTNVDSGKSVNKTHIMHAAYFFFEFFEHRRRQIVEYDFGTLLSFNNVIIIIMNTRFSEPPLVLASMFFHFEPDNDYAIRCISGFKYKVNSGTDCSY
jgi:hypothetical protein